MTKFSRPEKDSVVGSWRLDKLIGTGGQAMVWRARHVTEKHSPPAAIKVLPRLDAKSMVRFRREVHLLKSHKHPGIVSVRDHGEQDGIPYLVMELANASFDRLSANDSGGVRVLNETPTLLINFFRQACGAIAHLHANGVVHRDIKPSNILLMLDGPDPMRATVCDLGISAAVGEQRILTSTHESIGTPIYRAPEAIFGSHTKESDIYSLGKTLEFLFTRLTPSQMGPGRCARDARLTSVVWDALDDVMSKACALDPAHRYSDVGELLGALPALVVTLFASSSPSARTRVEPSLSTAEAITLAIIIAASPTKRESISVYSAQNESPLANYDTSIAIRNLEAVGLIESFENEDHNGNTFTALRPTASGVQWAIRHPEEMAATTSPDRSTADAADDRIPF